MFRNRIAAGLTLCALALVLATKQASAEDHHFKITGGGIAPNGLPLPGEPGRPHWAVGHATHLGCYYGEGEVQTDTATFNSDGTVTGQFGSPVPFLFTGENGDTLACYYGRTNFGAKQPGTFTLVPVTDLGAGWYVAHFVAEFVPYDPACTGKFKEARGGWIMYATTAPFVLGSSDPIAYSWEGEGSLELGEKH